jgi:hypothetical protein
MEEAQQYLRSAFDRWLAWALAIDPADLKHSILDRNLKAIGVR